MPATAKMMLIVIGALSVTVSRVRAQDACGLVTKQEVTEATGFAVDVMTPQTVGGATSCIYGAKSRQSVQVRAYTGDAASGAESVCKGGMPLRGLGDKACMAQRGPALIMEVNKGSKALVVLWLNAPAEGAEQGLRRLVMKALGRMQG
jgi:hypothetical protein